MASLEKPFETAFNPYLFLLTSPSAIRAFGRSMFLVHSPVVAQLGRFQAAGHRVQEHLSDLKAQGWMANKRELMISREDIVQTTVDTMTPVTDCFLPDIQFLDATSFNRDPKATQQWFSSFTEALGKKQFFCPGNQGCVTPKALSAKKDLAELTTLGKVLALAVANRMTVDLALCRHVRKFILGQPLRWPDFAFYDPAKFTYLCSLLEMTSEQLTKEGLTFSAKLRPEEKLAQEDDDVVELMSGGLQKRVTMENVHDYVELYAECIMYKQAQASLEALKDGFDVMRLGGELGGNGLNATTLSLSLAWPPKTTFSFLNTAPTFDMAKEMREAEVLSPHHRVVDHLHHLLKTDNQASRSALGRSLLPFLIDTLYISPHNPPKFTITVTNDDPATTLPYVCPMFSGNLMLPKYDYLLTLKDRLQLAMHISGLLD
eukprot:m.68962 g.68962  ORF g.68962 m.68962 type:complete len:431 (+) comp19942_c0_seq1:232-1524(+)